MSVLRNLESKIADLVEGTFGRVFRSEVRPVELARGLVKEMEEHKTVSVSRVYVPNEYVVWLSPEDRERFEGVEHEIADELGAYLLEHARREKLALVSRPEVTFQTDEALNLGEFGIQARLVRAQPDAAGWAGPAEQGDHGHTMVYSTSDRLREELDKPRGPEPTGRAMVLAEGKRMVVGRSRRRARPQPRVRRHARRPERLAPPRRDPAGRPRRLDRRGPRVDERREGQRPRDLRRRRASSRATASRWAPPTSASSWSRRARARSRLRRPEVRLPARPLPLPAVGRAQRAEGPAPRRRDERRAGVRRPLPVQAPDATGVHQHGGDGDGACSSSRARPATRPARATTSAAARRSGAATSRSCSRTRSRPRGTRASTARAARSSSRTSARRTARTSTRSCCAGPQPLHAGRPHPHRRLRLHVPDLMLRVAEEFHGTHTGQQRRANEDSLYARAPLFAVADGMGGAQAGEIASRIAVETLGGGVPDPTRRTASRSAWPTSSARRTSASTSSRAATTAAPGWARR